MVISELIWKLFLLLLPGVIATIMVRYITTCKQYSVFEFIVYSAIYGIGVFVIMELSYSLYSILSSIFIKDVKLVWGLNLDVWNLFYGSDKKINSLEIFISYLLSVPLGFLWGIIVTRNRLLELAKRYKLTYRYGDSDIWSYFLSSSNREWFNLINKRDNLTYSGKLEAYSETNQKRELILQYVIVYQSLPWQKLYELSSLYLDIDFPYSIEVPSLKTQDSSETEVKTKSEIEAPVVE
jgi:hypothetical protein